MLLNCPECELQVSDKAQSCPHCGYPIRGQNPVKSRKGGRYRLPNGFGRITEIKTGNLRNRFRVTVTVGKTPEGKPIGKLLKPKSFFHTYNEAYAALVEYNKNPYELEDSIKLYELYERWTESYFKTLKNESGTRTIKAAWAYCGTIRNMQVKDIRARHLKGCIEEGYVIRNEKKIYASPNTKARMKSLFNLMFDYAVEYEICDKNYAKTFVLSDEISEQAEQLRNAHIPFTDDEMNILWNNLEVPYVKLVLIQCYMGWRPQELGLLEISNVDFENGIITGGMKTDAGINRPVPIHPRIRNFVEEYYNEANELGSKYLFNCTDTSTHRSSLKMTYDKYRHRFENIIKILHLNTDHRPHDPRAHFVTIAKKHNVDEYALKYVVGHSISDLTEKVYTTRNIEWLIKEVQKIE